MANNLPPEANKFHAGNGDDGKHYWLTPPDLYGDLHARYSFTFDPCPFPKPADFDGLTERYQRELLAQCRLHPGGIPGGHVPEEDDLHVLQ